MIQPEPPPLPLAEPITDPTTRWRRVEALFHRAVDAPATERDNLVRLWCAGDDALLAEVLELLHSDSSIEHKLAALPPLPDSAFGESFAAPADSWLGRTLGSYRVTHELGRGGMGVVYLGERAAASALYPQAAIKVVRRNLQHSPAIGHFLLERDALARLEHPNIARLLDGGVTGEGIPFLIMEFIDGERMDLVCDRPETSIAEVLRLMIELCGAVAYVHRNLILHRDLKPGNVMVTTGDATREGSVKLLDFGTLKLLQPEALPFSPHDGATPAPDLPSAMTEAGMRPVTLRFASPEHVHGERVSTASDVYSLGIMLYRLIAGRFPEPRPEVSSKTDPGYRSPGAAFFYDLRDNRLEPPSAHATKSMPRELARDLDAITMKCMRYESGERYRTADALAAELTRALENRPVEARGDNRTYRARKFYGRHKLALWTGLAALIILVVGLIGVRRETRAAQAEQARADAGVEQERQLAHLLLFDYFEQLQQIKGSTRAQRQAVSQAVTYLDGLAVTVPSPAVKLETVRAYTAMGSLLGSPYIQNLGDVPGAIATLNKAIPIARDLAAANPRDIDDQKALASAQMALAQVYLGDGKPRQSLEFLTPASQVALKLAQNPQADVKTLNFVVTVLSTLGDVYSVRGSDSLHDDSKATAIFLQNVDLNQRILRLDPTRVGNMRGLAIAYTKLGNIAKDTDTNEAIAWDRKGLAALDAMPPAARRTFPVARSYSILSENLTYVYLYTAQLTEAKALLDQARQRALETIAADPVDARARYDLAAIETTAADGFDHARDYPAALMYCNFYLQSMHVLVQSHPANTTYQYLLAFGIFRHGKILTQNGRFAEGNAEMSRGLDLLLPMAEAPDAEADVLGATTDAIRDVHRNPAVDGPLAVSFMQRAVAAGSTPSTDQMLGLAQAQRYAGQFDASHATAREALARLEATPQGLGHASDIAQAKSLLTPAQPPSK